MIYVLKILGIPIVSLEKWEIVTEAEDVEDNGIAGGSTHDFERDPTPLSTDDRYAPDWYEFGFGHTRPEQPYVIDDS